MISAVSPYALLLACKPKESRSFSTEYDIFSAMHSSALKPSESELHSSNKHASISPENPPESAQGIQSQKMRTHYISGICARHDRAQSHVHLQN